MDNSAKIHFKMQPFTLGNWDLIVAQIQFVIEWFGIEHVHADDELTTLKIIMFKKFISHSITVWVRIEVT